MKIKIITILAACAITSSSFCWIDPTEKSVTSETRGTIETIREVKPADIKLPTEESLEKPTTPPTIIPSNKKSPRPMRPAPGRRIQRGRAASRI